MAGKVIIAPTLKNNRGLCSDCHYLKAVRLDSGKTVYLCQQFKAQLSTAVTECTEYHKELPPQDASPWIINIDPETKKVQFVYEHEVFHVKNGKVVKVRTRASWVDIP